MSNMAQPIGLNLKPEEMNENLRRHLEVVQWARKEIVRRKMQKGQQATAKAEQPREAG